MKIKQIILGILFFFIFYFEPLSILTIKFAHTWKVVLLTYLLINSGFKIRKDNITLYSFLYYFKYLLTTGVFYFGYFGDGLLMFLRGISIPIINNYLNVKKHTTITIRSTLIFIANFVILSSIPFLLGLLDPISSGYSLDQYGSAGEGYVGIFQNPHGAAIITSQALLVKFYFAIRQRRFRLVESVILALGFFILYKTYVRTGYLMFFLGAMVIVYFEYGVRQFYKLIPIIGLFAYAAFSFYSNDLILQRRILQRNVYQNKELVSIDDISSGRLTLSRINLQNYSESDILTQLFGMGNEYSQDLMGEKINKRLLSHNGFVDALVHNGIVGLVLYLLFLISILKVIIGNRKNLSFSLGMSSYFSFLAFIIFQGGNIFLMEVQLLLIIRLQENELIEQKSSL